VPITFLALPNCKSASDHFIPDHILPLYPAPFLSLAGDYSTILSKRLRKFSENLMPVPWPEDPSGLRIRMPLKTPFRSF
jgi:hypothetical protein